MESSASADKKGEDEENHSNQACKHRYTADDALVVPGNRRATKVPQDAEAPKVRDGVRESRDEQPRAPT